MKTEIKTEYNWEWPQYATVSVGDLAIKIEPGENFLKDLEIAKNKCKKYIKENRK